MTTAELIQYYANLLIIQYIGQPNAYATIQALVTMSVMNQLPIAVQNAFNMDGSAVGVQLDVLGKYAGVTRSGTGLLGQSITLDDTDFFTFIQLAIVTNSSGSSLATIQSFMNMYFPNEIFVFDYKDMRMSYLINSSIGNQNLIELFITEGKLPKPMGVQLAAPIYASNLKFFGMVDAATVATYAIQNSVSVSVAANAVATASNISPFNNATSPVSGQWLDARQGLAV